MNTTDSTTYSFTIKDAETFLETQEFHTILIYGGFFGLTLSYYLMFYLFGKFKTMNYILKILMNYMRSILAGFIVSMSALVRYIKLPVFEVRTGLVYLMLYIYPIVQFILLLAFLATFIAIYQHFKKSDFRDNVDLPIINIIVGEKDENSALIENNENSLSCYRKMKSCFDKIKIGRISWFKKFNDLYSPILILGTILLNAFYSGLGFSSLENIKVFEKILIIHKINEVYRINHAFKKLKAKWYFVLIYMFLFSILTPIGIFIKDYSIIRNIYMHNVPIKTFCDKISYRSLLITAIIENLAPFPASILEIVLNFLSFLTISLISGFLILTNHS
jgi:hypothetical protein